MVVNLVLQLFALECLISLPKMSYFPSKNVLFPFQFWSHLKHVEHDKHWNYFKVTCKHQGCIHKTRPGRIDRHQAKCNFRPCSSDLAAEEEEKKEVVEEESEVEEFDEVSSPMKRKFDKKRDVYLYEGIFFCFECNQKVCNVEEQYYLSQHFKRQGHPNNCPPL